MQDEEELIDDTQKDMLIAVVILLLQIGCDIATAAAAADTATTGGGGGVLSATSSHHDGFILDSSSSSSSSSRSTGHRGERELHASSLRVRVLAWQQNTTDFFFANNNCSTDSLISVSASVENNNILPLGKGVANILTSTKRASWYEETLSSLVVEYCQETLQHVRSRYVPKDNVTAAKDEYGACVQTADGDQDIYATGLLCERNANCYWEEPRESQARSRRYSDDQYEEYERAGRDYMQGLVLRYGTLGFLLAVAVFAGSVKFAVSRGIFNKCVCDGDLQRERTGYTTTEQKAPAAIFVAGFIVVAAAGFLGLQGNSNVTSGLDDMLTTTDGAIEDIHDLVSSLSSPLSSFVFSLNASAEEARTLIAGTDDWLGELEAGMLLRLEAFDSAHRHRFQGRGPEFDALTAVVKDAGAAFVSDVVTGLSAAMDVLQVDFLDMKTLMEGQSHNVLAALAVLNGTAAGLHDHLAYFRTMSDEYLGVRTGGVQALVAFSALAGAVGLLGVAAGLAESKPFAPCINFLRLTCIVTVVTTWTAFILSSLLVVSVVAWSDGCHFLKLSAARGWEAAGLDGQSAAVLDGCFRGRPVMEELNLTDALGFFESYALIAEEVGALDVTSAATQVETAVYAISDFVSSLNSTAIAVSLLDFYTDAKVNGSLLLDPDCLYNVTFGGGEAIEFLDRPWLALPTVTTATTVVDADDDDDDDDDQNSFSSATSSSNATDSTTESALTPWEAGGTRQSFGRQGDESASAYMSRVFNSSGCASLNDDLLKAWKFATRTRAIRDQMKDDLNCTTTTTTTTATTTTTTTTTSGGGDDTADSTDTDTTTAVEECSGNNSSSSSSSSSSSYVTSSSSSSSIYPFSRCPSSCTSDTYTAPDSLLAYFRAFIDDIDDLQADLSGLLSNNLPETTTTTTTPDGVLGKPLANSSEFVLLACCASRCSFLSLHYANFEGAVCGTALSGIAQVGFALFCMALGGLALAVTSGVMVHRLKANWARNLAKVLSTEEGIVMEEY